MINKWEINVYEHGDGWLQATVEDYEGVQLASVTAPVVEGATFDTKGAVILMAVAEAVTKEQADA